MFLVTLALNSDHLKETCGVQKLSAIFGLFISIVFVLPPLLRLKGFFQSSQVKRLISGDLTSPNG